MKGTKAKTSLSTAINPDLEGLRARVERRREYLELLETELTNTRGVIRDFTQVYNDRIAPLQKEQARLHLRVEELMVDQAPPSSGWRTNGHGQAPNGTERSKGHRENERIPKKKPAPNKDPDYERKIRDLFRRLAKRYHPDVARNDEERKHHEAIMAEINRAYMDKDLETLEALAKSHPSGFNGAARSPEAELARLTLELRQLEAMIFEVENTIRDLDLSPAMQMHSETKGDRKSKHDIFAEMEAELRARIAELQEQLIVLGGEIGKQN